MRMKKLRQIIAACMTGCVLLAGCGSTATEGTQQSSKLPQLVIGSDSYEPFNYINEDGEFAGVDVELAQEACRRIGLYTDRVGGQGRISGGRKRGLSVG